MKRGIVGDQQHNLEKQMGCMAGFLHIFDRHHILTGKRLPPPITDSSSEPPTSPFVVPSSSPSPTPKTPLPLPIKFSPRLSLDTYPDIASDNHQRRSTSVVARLMGLDEPIQNSEAELQISASESRANRDQSLPHHHYRFFDTKNNFQLKQNPTNASDPKQKKKSCFYDSGDFFPEKTKKTSFTVYGEIERRLKMRGIDEPYKDLHALKQILEALQLKGLLHSNNYKSTIATNQSPIVVMKPNKIGRNLNHSPQPSSFVSSPRHYRAEPEALRTQLQGSGRNLRQPARGESCVHTSPNRMRNVAVAPVNSVKVNMRRNVPEQQVTSRSPRIRKGSYHKEEEEEKKMVLRSMAEEDESSTVSHTTTKTERFKIAGYREGRNILERCDKLLNSIAEMAATTTELQQPSPVSVLDSSFYKDESPSPVMKRCIDYKGDSEDEMWSAALCYNGAQYEDSDDFHYVSEIVRACDYFPNDINVFMLLEKQQFLKGNDICKASMLRRRLIFDTIQEILNKNKRLPPWKADSLVVGKNKLDWIWLEFRRMREREEEGTSEEEELFDVICAVLKKDMAEDVMNECPVEMGDVVLDIERLVFKDLIGQIIQDLVSFKGPHCSGRLSRKLMF